MTTDQERWARVRVQLRGLLGEEIFTSWFARMEIEGIEIDTVKVSVPTRFLRSWVQSHYAERLLGCWQDELPAIRRIELTVRSAVLRPLPQKAKQPEAPPVATDRRDVKPPSDIRPAAAPISAVHDALGGSPLDPRLTFETFVIGRSNTLAHAAAKQVAQGRRGDAVMFNPLYIHAGVGLGKTHLLQSVAWAGNAAAERKVLYLTAEKFMYGFVAALRAQNALAFKDALRTIDVLVIDDLQFLQGKSTQAEFCHTLNALIDSGRQVVIASDRPPSDLETLDERVRSRLAGGLVVEIGALGEELRLEILKARVAAAKLHHPGLRRAGLGVDLRGEVGDPQRTRPRRRAEPSARTQQAHRPAGDAGNGRAGGARPDPPAGAQADQDRGDPAHRCAAIQCEPR